MVFLCDAHSYYNQLSININLDNLTFFCNGVIGIPGITINVVAVKSSSPYHHHDMIEQLNGTCTLDFFASNGKTCFNFYFQNFLELSFNQIIEIISTNLGNMLEQICCNFTGGRCDGDTFSYIAIFEANDQFGCSLPSGLFDTKAIKALSIINGVCQSECHLHYGFQKYHPGISDNCMTIGLG